MDLNLFHLNNFLACCFSFKLASGGNPVVNDRLNHCKIENLRCFGNTLTYKLSIKSDSADAQILLSGEPVSLVSL